MPPLASLVGDPAVRVVVLEVLTARHGAEDHRFRDPQLLGAQREVDVRDDQADKTDAHHDHDFLAFSAGLFALAGQYGVQLVGGDTCRGPLTLTVQMHGFVPEGKALRRAGARPGDVIYVTGTLGDAALALRVRSGSAEELSHAHAAFLAERLERPTPRVREGMALRGIASAAIDISDGLAADLGHILKASGVGATVEVENIPVSTAFTAMAKHRERWNLLLSGGDDYELCFTVPPEKQAAAEQLLARYPGGCTRIGVIESRHGLRCLLNGEIFEPAASGYQHFSN